MYTVFFLNGSFKEVNERELAYCIQQHKREIFGYRKAK